VLVRLRHSRREALISPASDRLCVSQYRQVAAEETPRHFRIVLDHSRHHLGRRIGRRVSALAGAFLVVLGLTASIPAIPATVAVAGLAVAWASGEPNRGPADDIPVREVILVWAVATPLAIGGLRIGLRLVRRNRTLILFLRRFRYDDAQDAVTFAVLRTIGASWRVVTLDDAELAPVGVATAPRLLFRAGQLGWKHVLAIAQFLGVRTFPFIVMAMWGVVALGLVGPALEWARTGTTTPEVWMDAVNPYLSILGSVFDRRPPVEFLGPTLPGLFALLAMAAALSFATLIVTMGALLLAFPLGSVLFFLSSAAASVREADLSKAMTVSSVADIQQAARQIAMRSRKVFGPRLVVLRVKSHAWQRAVSELASLSSLHLIDISEPTDNIVWELEELISRFGDKCVLIGHYEQVVALAALPQETDVVPAARRRLAALLHGREVLAYTTDGPGLRRFAHALRGLLLTRSA